MLSSVVREDHTEPGSPVTTNTNQSSKDHELVAGMLASGDWAWAEFHRRYDRLIYRCISKVTGRFSKIVSTDDMREIHAALVLQLLANGMHKLRSFDPDRGSCLGTWVGMLAVHAAYDHLRTLRRESNRGSLQEVDVMQSDQVDPYGEAERRQRERMVAALLCSLSAKDREFVSLYFEKGLDPDQVAAQMNISVKTVYSKKNKIRTRLERMLQRQSLAA